MKKVRIIALHLAFGGIEKAICCMANLFAERYEVEIISVYNMPNAPAFPLDGRVKVRYLLSDTPNREEWKAAFSGHDLAGFARESLRAVKILRDKKRAVIDAAQTQLIALVPFSVDISVIMQRGAAGLEKSPALEVFDRLANRLEGKRVPLLFG